MKTKHYVPIVRVVIFTSILIPGVAMGFRPFQICMFSEVNAVVTLHGKPVTGAEVVRTSNELDSKVYTEQTTTDAQGRFHFDALWKFSLSNWIPANPMISQRMNISYKGREYMAWWHSKRDYGHNDELDDNKPLNFTCELSEEPTMKHQEVAGPVDGICKW